MSNSNYNDNSGIQPINAQEIKQIYGGESQMFSEGGFTASGTGDFVDIQRNVNSISVSSQSSSNSGFSSSSSSSSQ